MIRILILVLWMTPLFGESQPPEKKFALLSSSELTIHGTSNVNEFSCVFAPDMAGSVQLIYNPGNQKFPVQPVRFPISCFDCGGKMINRDFRNILKADQFPELQLRLVDVKPDTEGRANVIFDLRIAGQNRLYAMPVGYNMSNNHGSAHGKIKINIEDFGLEQPKKMLGLIVVDKEIEIRFKIDFLQIPG